MSASYKGFWIIVGMTVGAVVIANSTAKTKRSSTHSGSTYTDATNSKRVFPSSSPTPSEPTSAEASPPLQSSTPTIASVPATPSPTSTAESPSDSNSTSETRSIDADFQVAFDRAMEVALATPKAASTTEPIATPSSDAFPPPLETREIVAQPKIFDQSITMQVGDETDQPDMKDRALTTTDLNLREGPGPDYLKVETMAKGTELVVLERSGKWWRVRSMASSTEGWINGTFVTAKN
ncbi:SH3 domain-containing protein [Rhizobium sp. NZLR8]|uniref:SH3 domain-containing protein n=1 Tax=Rhizobium sp. NZLR8 TaxID=2731104 RepID=UPI001C82C59F|nr:SH3 domain-containing protein [Rhizobium sp. NZLR8]MBX5157681.1 SH3 domain-containing protein [Rhizobium sp. NZLR8]